MQYPCPGQEQPLVEEVKAASTAAQYSSTSIAGPAGGGAVGRVAAVRSLVLCSSDTVVGGMAPLSIYACDDFNAASADARGAIVGNLACWAGACALTIVVVAAYAHFSNVPLRSSIEALGAPSQLLPLAVVTVPSTVSGTFYLLRDVQCALDGVVAVIGVLMCACPVSVLCWVAYMAPLRLVRVDSQERASPSRTVNICIPRALRTPIAVLFHRRVRWIDASVLRTGGGVDAREKHDSRVNALEAENDCTGASQRPPPSWRRLATVILLDYALVWYVCVDVTVLTAAGFLGAVSSLGSGSACRASAVVVLVLYLGQLVLCAVVRPFTTLFSHIYALVTLALAIIGIACQVWYVFEAEEGGNYLDLMSRVLLAAAACDLLVSGISVLKTVMDVGDALKALRRLFVEGVVIIEPCSSVGGHDQEVLPSQLVDDERDVMEELFSLAGSVCDAAPDYNYFVAPQDGDNDGDESEFWNADGTAAVCCLCSPRTLIMTMRCLCLTTREV